MQEIVTALRRWLRDVFGRLDAWVNRLYGWKYNPLYMSGTLVVLFLAILLVTGLYLLLFYRIGAPYESVARITDQVWLGRWIRGLHRFASDAAMVAAGVHALRLFAQNRYWGQRALAWVSGLVLLAIILVSGWTGYVMVWDVQAQVLAVEGARIMDALPIFSEPISRAFTGAEELPGAFFFLNLFLHVAIPVGMGAVLYLHVARVARANLLPPKKLAWAAGGLLTALAVLWPIGMAERADLLEIPGSFPLDVFFGFWLPVTRALPAGGVWLVGGLVVAAVVLVPWWARPPAEERPAPSVVEQRYCTGCRQCYLDCPYEAIDMLPRTDGRDGMWAEVSPDLCVSCGICAGSCAPMRVGPPGRTGRDQLTRAREFVEAAGPGPGDLVIVACERGAGGITEDPSSLDVGAGPGRGVHVYPTACAGSVHTSVMELFLRSGAGGLVVAACPPRDCWNREGPTWLEGRMFEDREAELQERVDRSRVRLVHAGPGERRVVRTEAGAFAAEIRRRAARDLGDEIDLIRMCREPEGSGEATP